MRDTLFAEQTADHTLDELARPAQGLFRSFTTALGSLARTLTRAEMHADGTAEREAVEVERESAQQFSAKRQAAEREASGEMPAVNAVEMLFAKADSSSNVAPAIDWSKFSSPELSSIRGGLVNLLEDLSDDGPGAMAQSSDLGQVESSVESGTQSQPKDGLPRAGSDYEIGFDSLRNLGVLLNSDGGPEKFEGPPETQNFSTSASAQNGRESFAATPERADNEAPRYAILSGKTVGVVGFSEMDAIGIGRALAAQRCSFLALTHTDAEFRQGATAVCDLLLVNVRPEWTAQGTGEISAVLTTKKPAVFVADRDTLLGAASIGQGGYRDFVPVHAVNAGELVWRCALLLSRCPAHRVRPKKKNKQAQIIIGDDDPSSRTLVHAILAQEGMQCHAADNGAQALALARGKGADAVILDVNMPGLDGFQVLAEIKRDPSLAQTRVILLTTRQAEADVLRGFGLGADDYITKPFSPLELAARVKRLLGRPA